MLAVSLVGCASNLPDQVEVRYSERELLPRQAPFAGPEDSLELAPVDVLAIDAEMQRFLDGVISESPTQKFLLLNLLDGLLDSGPIKLQYENLKTYTAIETFHSREGNCLSFTNLFVALARRAGMTVYFQEVTVPHNWERQGETWIYNRHINAWVDLGIEGEFAVDFNLNPVETEYERKRISDREALAQYHNNMGVYWMQGDRLDLSYLHLREAISLSRREAYFWTNLGVLYRRAGDDARAESAWLHALEIDSEPSAASNLARYYRLNGDAELAELFRERVERFRRKNPFYLYDMAESAYYRGEYGDSINLLKQAINIRENEEEFYRLLGLNYVRIGDIPRAREAFALALEYAPSGEHRRIYSQKQRLLEGSR